FSFHTSASVLYESGADFTHDLIGGGPIRGPPRIEGHWEDGGAHVIIHPVMWTPGRSLVTLDVTSDTGDTHAVYLIWLDLADDAVSTLLDGVARRMGHAGRPFVLYSFDPPMRDGWGQLGMVMTLGERNTVR